MPTHFKLVAAKATKHAAYNLTLTRTAAGASLVYYSAAVVVPSCCTSHTAQFGVLILFFRVVMVHDHSPAHGLLGAVLDMASEDAGTAKQAQRCGLDDLQRRTDPEYELAPLVRRIQPEMLRPSD